MLYKACRLLRSKLRRGSDWRYMRPSIFVAHGFLTLFSIIGPEHFPAHAPVLVLSCIELPVLIIALVQYLTKCILAVVCAHLLVKSTSIF